MRKKISMSENEKLRGYFFTNMYLSGLQKGLQSAHAVHDAFVKYEDPTIDIFHPAYSLLWEWARHHRTMVILDAGYHEEIEDLATFFDTDDNPYPWEIVNEAEDALRGAATCVMIVLPEEIYKTAEKVRKGKYKPDKDIEDDTVEKRLEREFGSWKGQLIKRLNQYRLAH